ncbi:MAG: hypothetical protein AB7F98_17230 [Novosphingobium sp.]
MKNVFGGLMLGCGLLIAGVAGGIALVVWSLSRDTAFPLEYLNVLIAPALVGLAIAAIGLAVIMVGRKARQDDAGSNASSTVRPATPPADPTSPPE